MKKIITTMAIVCLSFSCFAEDYFVKVADNEYVLQHGEKSEDLNRYAGDMGRMIFDAVYTPTHIFTYPDGTPSLFRNIQKIEYTESKVTFFKSIKSRRCCIDILADQKNTNKCRIIGVNGHNIGSFEVYEAEEDANSFTDSKQRLIYIDHTGLYIVSEEENPIEDISKNYFLNRKFDFKGEIIKISAIDGKRKISGVNFNCQNDASTPFEESSEFAPVIEQIKKITGIKPKVAPPSKESALKRVAEILDVPEELLVVEEGQVKLIGHAVGKSEGGKYPIDVHSLFAKSLYPLTIKSSLYNQIKGVIPVSIKELNELNIKVVDDATIKRRENYKFDTSDEAKKRRKEIALKPWD